MKTLSEIAHAHNINSFEQLASFLSSYQIYFKSKNGSINHTKMKQLSIEAKKASAEVENLTNNYCQALISREKTFAIIPEIGNILQTHLTSLNLPKSTMRQSQKLAKKLGSFQAISNENLKTLTLEVKETGKHLREIDNLESKYDKIMLAFSLMISLLESCPDFHSTESIPCLASLKESFSKLRTANNTLKEIRSEIVKARMGRYNIMYKTNHGLVDIAHDTKVFVKSNYGGESKEWKQVQAIEFKRLK